MPCYIMVASLLGVDVPVRVDEERVEEYLRRQLGVPTRRHEDLRDAINKTLARDPEVLKIMLIEAFAYAGEKREGELPLDRLSQLRKRSPSAKREVEAQEVIT